jgi:hypothetical protein
MHGHIVFRGTALPATQRRPKIRAEKRMSTLICQGKGGFAPIPGGIALAILCAVAQ